MCYGWVLTVNIFVWPVSCLITFRHLVLGLLVSNASLHNLGEKPLITVSLN